MCVHYSILREFNLHLYFILKQHWSKVQSTSKQDGTVTHYKQGLHQYNILLLLLLLLLSSCFLNTFSE